MTFRQNEIFVKELVFVSTIMIVLAAIMMIKLNHWMLWMCVIGFALSIPFILRTEPWVTMNEQGVRCFTKKEVLWDYPWEEIAEVRRITNMRSRGIQLVPVDKRNRDLCIQLSKTCKRALEAYCPGLRK